MEKYFLTYNINDGGSCEINKNYPHKSGHFEGSNIRKMVAKVNNILREYNAKKGSPFNWWYDISSMECFIKSVTNFTYDN
jgi:hypothetical protein